MPGAWTAPSTFTSGQIITDTILNAQLRDNLLWLGGLTGVITQVASVVIGSNFTTTSTAPVDVTGATVTLTTTGGTVLVLFSGPAHAVTGQGALNFNQDGVDGATAAALTAGGQLSLPVALITRYSPAAGSHTYKLRADITSGTLSMLFSTAANGFLVAIELAR